MFILHAANRSETLLDTVQSFIQNQPLRSEGDLFAKEIFLIQSQGMDKWLTQSLAQRLGVWAQADCLFPNRFFNQLAQRLGLSLHSDTYERDVMIWRLLALFDHPALPSYLQHYLTKQPGSKSRFVLAVTLAQLFDQYQLQRPQWLDTWHKGLSFLPPNDLLSQTSPSLQHLLHTEQWQADLWRLLQAQQGDTHPHRGQLWQALIRKLQRLSRKDKALLPPRVVVFGINTFSPLALQVLHALSAHLDVHLCLLVPNTDYWQDMPNKRSQLQRYLHWQNQQPVETAPDQSEIQLAEQQHDWFFPSIDTHHHPLLVALIEQSKDFQALLLEQATFDLELQPQTPLPTDATALHQLQHQLQINDAQPLTPDSSLQIHGTHSTRRELQVAKNQLLAAFAEHPDLALHNCAIMAPDLTPYSPLIGAVFDDIPHQVADQNQRQLQSPLDALHRWCELVQSRWQWPELLAVLNHPAIAPLYDLTDIDLQWIQHWVESNGVKWGQNKHHVQQQLADACPAIDTFFPFTWDTAKQRWLLGLVMQGDAMTQPCLGQLPADDLHSADAVALGGLLAFLDDCDQLHQSLQNRRTISAWCDTLQQFTTQVCERIDTRTDTGTAAKDHFLRTIHTWLDDSQRLVKLAQSNVLFESDYFLHWMNHSLNQSHSAHGFLQGQLTFCQLLPMRAIPFDIIIVLGMNDGHLPSPEQGHHFDLMQQCYPRQLGDRSKAADERQQFLELLLCARRQLIFTYQSRHSQTNETLAPSALLQTLLDHLCTDTHKSSWVTHHPLHATDPWYFDTTNPPHWDAHIHQQARYLMENTTTDTSAWLNLQALPTEHRKKPPTLLHWADWIQACLKPLTHFVSQHYGITFSSDDNRHDSNEMFAYHGLDLYQQRQQTLQQPQQQHLRQQLHVSQPLEPVASLIWQPIADALAALQRCHAQHFPDLVKSPSSALQVPCASWPHLPDAPVVFGQLGQPPQSQLQQHGSHVDQVLRWPHEFKSERLLAWWLQHLLLQASLADHPSATKVTTHVWCLHDHHPILCQFSPLHPAKAISQLLAWQRWLQGSHGQIPLVHWSALMAGFKLKPDDMNGDHTDWLFDDKAAAKKWQDQQAYTHKEQQALQWLLPHQSTDEQWQTLLSSPAWTQAQTLAKHGLTHCRIQTRFDEGNHENHL